MQKPLDYYRVNLTGSIQLLEVRRATSSQTLAGPKLYHFRHTSLYLSLPLRLSLPICKQDCPNLSPSHLWRRKGVGITCGGH